MLNRTNTSLAIACIMSLGMATTTTAFAKTNCQKLFDRYMKAPGHKAFATTLGNDPGFHPTTCSFFSGFSFKKLAQQKAVQDCNRNRRKEDGGKCKVIHSR